MSLESLWHFSKSETRVSNHIQVYINLMDKDVFFFFTWKTLFIASLDSNATNPKQSRFS